MAAQNLACVAVAGATGYMGSRMVPRPLELGYKEVAINRSILKLRIRVTYAGRFANALGKLNSKKENAESPNPEMPNLFSGEP